MTPAAWIALAYGIVTVTLLVYTLGLRRRLHRAEQTRSSASPGESSR